MSTNTRRRHSPQGQNNTAGKRHGNGYTQAQHSVLPGGRADGVDQPFPSKPVSHRRPPNPAKQDEKITIPKQARRTLSPKEPDSHGVRKTTGSRHPRKDSHRQPSGEVQMAKAIHAKELVLQEKLWSVEEKIRQIIQKETAAGNEKGSEEQRHNRGQAQTKTRLSEQQRREPERRREMIMQERRQEDERTRGERSDIKDPKGIHQITVHKQDTNGKLNKSRWENVKEQTRGRKGGDEKDDGIYGDTGVKLQDGTEKAKERDQNITSLQQPTGNHRPEQGQLRQKDSTDASLQLLPCTICNRKFMKERLQKHVQICQKVKKSKRQVFNSSLHRTKGSAIEEFWKTHTRPESPEALKKKDQRQKQKSHTRNLHEGRLPAGTSQPKRSK
ncbi:zinc finger C2HC domain-containing protein 1C [Centropristis striata]|uniref:zinc finger C2HC domain-containing protein 1C n=1 Tax=Centropristis striata TaxID=184440 RepID=UPI0027E0A38F|nr:zinc finger C2HC domain-containing protein 1C [Centropristis striata]